MRSKAEWNWLTMSIQHHLISLTTSLFLRNWAVIKYRVDQRCWTVWPQLQALSTVN